jgi:hypothetical protein
MADLNVLACNVDKKNTGTGDCWLNMKKLIGAFEIPKGMIFTQAQLADFEATLKAAIAAVSKAERIFPIGGWRALVDGSEEPVFQALGYGTPEPVRDGNVIWTFQYTKGGICLSNALRSRNNGFGDFIFYDDQGIIFGTRVTDPDGNPALGGVPVDVFYAFPWKANDGTNITQYRVQFVFQPAFINENIGFVKVDFQPATLNGLQNINLVSAAAPAAGVFQIRTLTGCAQTNLFDVYATQLAAAALWKAYNKATGAEIAITSVAQNVGLKAFTVTLDSADPDYPATATADVIVQLVDTAALAAADVVGYEGIPVTLKRG